MTVYLPPIRLCHKAIPIPLKLPRTRPTPQRARPPPTLEMNRLREQIHKPTTKPPIAELDESIASFPKVQPSSPRVPRSPTERQLQALRFVGAVRNEDHAGFPAELEAAKDFVGFFVGAEEDAEVVGAAGSLVFELGTRDAVDAGQGVDVGFACGGGFWG